MIMDTIKFYDFAPTKRRAKKQNVRVYGNRISISSDIGKEISNAGMTHIRLANNPLTGEWFIVFTKGVGLTFIYNKSHAIVVNCKEMFAFLTAEVGIKPNTDYSLSDNRSNIDDVYTYKIMM